MHVISVTSLISTRHAHVWYVEAALLAICKNPDLIELLGELVHRSPLRHTDHKKPFEPTADARDV